MEPLKDGKKATEDGKKATEDGKKATEDDKKLTGSDGEETITCSKCGFNYEWEFRSPPKCSECSYSAFDDFIQYGKPCRS